MLRDDGFQEKGHQSWEMDKRNKVNPWLPQLPALRKFVGHKGVGGCGEPRSYLVDYLVEETELRAWEDHGGQSSQDR